VETDASSALMEQQQVQQQTPTPPSPQEMRTSASEHMQASQSAPESLWVHTEQVVLEHDSVVLASPPTHSTLGTALGKARRVVETAVEEDDEAAGAAPPLAGSLSSTSSLVGGEESVLDEAENEEGAAPPLAGLLSSTSSLVGGEESVLDEAENEEEEGVDTRSLKQADEVSRRQTPRTPAAQGDDAATQQPALPSASVAFQRRPRVPRTPAAQPRGRVVVRAVAAEWLVQGATRGEAAAASPASEPPALGSREPRLGTALGKARRVVETAVEAEEEEEAAPPAAGLLSSTSSPVGGEESVLDEAADEEDDDEEEEAAPPSAGLLSSTSSLVGGEESVLGEAEDEEEGAAPPLAGSLSSTSSLVGGEESVLPTTPSPAHAAANSATGPREPPSRCERVDASPGAAGWAMRAASRTRSGRLYSATSTPVPSRSSPRTPGGAVREVRFCRDRSFPCD
jgi:hypothetical protein